MTFDVSAFRAAVVQEVRRWATLQARARGMDVSDPRTRDWIESLIRYRLQATTQAAPTRVAIPGNTGTSEIGAAAEIITPVAFTFLCFPSAYGDYYGYSSTGDALSFHSLDSLGQWQSPIVKVTQDGHEWGVSCMNTGWYYWLGDEHTADNWESVSWGFRIAVPEGGDYYDRLDDQNIWEDQAQAVDTGDIVYIPSAACKVTIVSTEYYRWYEPQGTIVRQRAVSGTTVQSIALTGMTGTPRYAEFNASGTHLVVATDDYRIFEFDIGTATTGPIAATLRAEATYTDVSYSDTINPTGTLRTKIYAGTYNAPVTAGYAGDTLKIGRVHVKDDFDYEFAYSPDQDDTFYTWPSGGGDVVVQLSDDQHEYGATYAAWTIPPDIEYGVNGGTIARSLWVSIDNVKILGDVLLYTKTQHGTDRGLNAGPDYYMYDCSSVPTPGGPYELDCVDVLGGNPCADLYDTIQNFCSIGHPLAPVCPECNINSSSYPDYVMTKEEEGYAAIYIPIRGIDAGGSLASYVLGGKIRLETRYNATSPIWNDIDKETFTETWKVACSEEPTEQVVTGVTASATSWLWSEATSEQDLRDKIKTIVDNAVITSPNSGNIDAITHRLSTSAYVWSTRIRNDITLEFNGHTSINGTVPIWMPTNGHLVGWFNNYADILEAPCPVPV